VVTERLADCRRACAALAAGVGVLTRQRDRAVLEARAEGATLAEIGAAIGMSGVGVGKLIARQSPVTVPCAARN
jgi:hypothetical protein